MKANYSVKELETRARKYSSMSCEELKEEYSFLTNGLNKYWRFARKLQKDTDIPEGLREPAVGLLRLLNESLVRNIKFSKKK